MQILESEIEHWNSFVEKNQDPYGYGVVKYAISWANLMEKEINTNHKELKNIAEKTSFEADIDGITGFMYGCTISILSQCWIYGKELKEWHNKKYNYNGNEIINPVIINRG